MNFASFGIAAAIAIQMNSNSRRSRTAEPWKGNEALEARRKKKKQKRQARKRARKGAQ
jgi:hypothetical protein